MKQSINLLAIVIVGILLLFAAVFLNMRSGGKEYKVEVIKQVTEVSAFASIDYSTRVDNSKSNLDKAGFEELVKKGVESRFQGEPGVSFEYLEEGGMVHALRVTVIDYNKRGCVKGEVKPSEVKDKCDVYTSSQSIDNTVTEMETRQLVAFDLGGASTQHEHGIFKSKYINSSQAFELIGTPKPTDNSKKFSHWMVDGVRTAQNLSCRIPGQGDSVLTVPCARIPFKGSAKPIIIKAIYIPK